MALLDTPINLRELPQSTSNFTPLPAGEYNAHISGAQIKDTKSGAGKYISVCFDIMGPTHQGRKLFANINVRNQSQVAEQIGREQLGDLTRAIGLSGLLNDTDQLIGGSCIIRVKVKKSEGYDDSNEVVQYKAAGAAMAQALPKAGPPEPLEPNAKYVGDNSPPWAKK